MTKKKRNTVLKIVAWILLAAILAGGLAFLLKYTSNGTEEFKVFLLTVTDEETGTETEIMNAETEMTFSRGHVYRFDTKYLFDGPSSESRGYHVTIGANPARDFTFSVGDLRDVWRTQNDLTDAFDLVQGDSRFELSFPADFSPETVLGRHYGAYGTVQIPPDVSPGGDHFLLTVSSYNGTAAYRIVFSVAYVAVEVSPGHIIF